MLLMMGLLIVVVPTPVLLTSNGAFPSILRKGCSGFVQSSTARTCPFSVVTGIAPTPAQPAHDPAPSCSCAIRWSWNWSFADHSRREDFRVFRRLSIHAITYSIVYETRMIKQPSRRTIASHRTEKFVYAVDKIFYFTSQFSLKLIRLSRI